MSNGIYNSFKRDSMLGRFDLTNDIIKIILVNNYSIDDAHTKYADVKRFEISGVGYTPNDKILTGVTLTVNNENDSVTLDALDVTWSASTLNSNGAILYKDTGDENTSPLICFIDFGAEKSSSNGDFIIQWNFNGIISLS